MTKKQAELPSRQEVNLLIWKCYIYRACVGMELAVSPSEGFIDTGHEIIS